MSQSQQNVDKVEETSSASGHMINTQPSIHCVGPDHLSPRRENEILNIARGLRRMLESKAWHLSTGFKITSML